LSTPGGCKFEVNTLNWREIARTVLLWHSLKLLGAIDSDIIAYVKGRGHTTTPEPPDKRTLKLIKKRLAFNFNDSKALRKKLFGFSAGLNICIRGPCPLFKTGPSWQSLVASLADVDDSAGWVVRLIIEAAAEAAVTFGVEKESYAERAAELLRVALSPLYFKFDDAKLSKRICFFALTRFGGSKGNAKVTLHEYYIFI
jgi:hypothetical protein